MQNLEKILEIKNEHIKFLQEEIEKNMDFLYSHGLICPQCIIEKENELNSKIKQLEFKS